MKKMAVIFPGIGYHADKPLLYYGRKVAIEAGFEDYINISYSCPVKKIRGDREKGVPINVYSDINHSLETDDTMHNLDILKDAMTKSREYIGGKA